MGIDPKIWGPSAWTLIHTISFRIKTAQDLNNFKHMIYSFLWILPCEKCRRNFDQHLINLPVPNVVEEVPKWAVNIHNRVSGSAAYTWAMAKKEWEGKTITVSDIYTFIHSIAETHPSMRSIDSCYRENLDKFVKALGYFTPLPPISKEGLSSRKAVKAWVRKIGKIHGIKDHTSVKACGKNQCLSRF